MKLHEISLKATDDCTERLRWWEVWAYRGIQKKRWENTKKTTQWPGVLAALVKHAQVKAHDDPVAVLPLHVLLRSEDIWSALWRHQMSNMLLFFYVTQMKWGGEFVGVFFSPILSCNTEGRWRNLQELLWVLVKQLVNQTWVFFPLSFSSLLLWPFPSGSGFWLVLERRQRFTLAHW